MPIRPPEVLEDLEAGDPVAGQADPDDLAAADLAAVAEADDAAGPDRPVGILEERPDDLEQRVFFQDGVRVHGAEQRIARDVQAGVQRVGLLAVGLVDDDQLRMEDRPVDAAEGLGGEGLPEHELGRLELEGLDELIQGRVGRAVVDDDDLENGIAQGQERADAVDDALGLVIGRDDDRDGLDDGHAEELAEADEGDQAAVAEDAGEREDVEHDVEGVDEQKVSQDEPVDPGVEEAQEVHHAGPPVRTTVSRTIVAMSAAKRSSFWREISWSCRMPTRPKAARPKPAL
jgi:hypothetical protein